MTREEIVKEFEGDDWFVNDVDGETKVWWCHSLYNDDYTETYRKCVNAFCDFISDEILKYEREVEDGSTMYNFWLNRGIETYEELEEMLKQFKDPKNKKIQTKNVILKNETKNV